MSAKDILHEHLLVGETVTVSFASKKDIISMRSSLSTAKRRLEESAAKFGFPSGTEDQSIYIDTISDDGTTLVCKIWLGKKQKPTPYKIISVDTSPTPTETPSTEPLTGTEPE